MQHESHGGETLLAQPANPKRLQNLSFLVCEGEPQSQRLLKNWLSLQGAHVAITSTLVEASERLRSRRFDVVIVELSEIYSQPKLTLHSIRDLGFNGPICAFVPMIFSDAARNIENLGYSRCFIAGSDSNLVIDELVSLVERSKELSAMNTGASGIISTYIGNPVVRRVLRNFIDGLSGRFDQLSTAAKINDLSSVETVAHSLRGTAGNFGYPQIMEVCSHIESSVRSERKVVENDINELRSLVEQAKVGYATFTAGLSAETNIN